MLNKVFKIAFTAKDEEGKVLEGKDGKSFEIAVNKPNVSQKREAKKIWNKTFKDAVDSGAFLRQELQKEIQKRKLFDKDKEEALKRLNEELEMNVLKCTKGGIKLSEAKDCALKARVGRLLLSQLLQDIQAFVSKSAESQADDAEFDYLVSACTVYNTSGEVYFKDLDDYLERKEELNSYTAANNLAILLHGYNPDFEKELPENKFLSKHGFVDDDLRLIEKEEKTEVKEEVVETQPFLDDEGEPIK